MQQTAQEIYVLLCQLGSVQVMNHEGGESVSRARQWFNGMP
jgi:hypothetical protein